MSEFHTVQTEFLQDNEGALIKALQDIGYEPIVYEDAVHLEGYRGDKREQKAHIVIPRKQISNASNDIGFERLENGKYRLHVSEFDETGWKKQSEKLVQYYGKAVVESIAESSDYSMVEEVEDEDGTIRIRMRINEY
tara:strand:+ start:399241 stop:399651 length:411 start_codon:yes stop_codon:yes gene_type:complete